MASPDRTASSRDEVWRPSSRGFLVYYVAIAVAVFGPLINPAVGVPPWLGVVLGLLVAAMLIFQKYGQEFRANPEGLKRVGFWPAKEAGLAWPEVGEIQVQRGLTQTMLNVGNLVILDKSGTPRLYWERLADPKAVKEILEARRTAYTKASGEEVAGG